MPVPARPYVLLAEDDDDDCMFFTEAFVEVNINLDLIRVNNGVELMNYLLMESIKFPQMIFLDLNMPFKNGFECLEELKSIEKLKDIPVIIYSTSHAAADVEKSQYLKAHVYLTKPNSFTQLKKVIQKVLITDFVNHLIEPPKEKFLVFSED